LGVQDLDGEDAHARRHTHDATSAAVLGANNASHVRAVTCNSIKHDAGQ
jgi:hypothetical protein